MRLITLLITSSVWLASGGAASAASLVCHYQGGGLAFTLNTQTGEFHMPNYPTRVSVSTTEEAYMFTATATFGTPPQEVHYTYDFFISRLDGSWSAGNPGTQYTTGTCKTARPTL